MTAEWAFLICWLSGLGSIIWFKKGGEPLHAEELKRIWEFTNKLSDRLTKLETTNQELHRIADETQKLLSRENLAKGLRPVR